MPPTPQRFGQSARLAQVQPPVIPIIHGLIRQYPDTISLGQGVVYYDPPPETARALRNFARTVVRGLEPQNARAPAHDLGEILGQPISGLCKAH